MGAFRRAPEVAAVAADLIPQFHPHLKEVRMEYCFGEEASKSKGHIVAGKAMLVTGVNAELPRLISRWTPSPSS